MGRRRRVPGCSDTCCFPQGSVQLAACLIVHSTPSAQRSLPPSISGQRSQCRPPSRRCGQRWSLSAKLMINGRHQSQAGAPVAVSHVLTRLFSCRPEAWHDASESRLRGGMALVTTEGRHGVSESRLREGMALVSHD